MARRKTGKATEYQTSSGGKKAAEKPADAVEDAVVADAEAAVETAVDGADSGAETTDVTDSLASSEMADEVLDAVPSDVVEGEKSASGDEIANIFDEIPEASGDDSVMSGDETPAGDVVADADDVEAAADDAVTGADDTTGEMSADAGTPKETELEPEPAVAAAPVAPPSEGGGMGFVPLVLGGLVAGGIGWAVATFGADAPPPPPAPVDNSERVDALEQGLQQLQADFADSPPPEDAVDLTAIETAQADLAALLAETSARIDAIEASAPAAAPDAPAIAGSLRDDLTALAAALDETNAAVSARIDALEARADAVITGAETAEAAAADAIRRAAVNEVTIALRNGTPFGEAAAALGDLPEAVEAGAESGLPTTGALADEFPALSRDALRAARANGDEEGIGGLARSLLGARSIEPREGDSADAVLSRVGAAVDAGDLATALTEAEALPPEAAAVLEDWINRVRARAAADAALQDYLEG